MLGTHWVTSPYPSRFQFQKGWVPSVASVLCQMTWLDKQTLHLTLPVHPEQHVHTRSPLRALTLDLAPDMSAILLNTGPLLWGHWAVVVSYECLNGNSLQADHIS